MGARRLIITSISCINRFIFSSIRLRSILLFAGVLVIIVFISTLFTEKIKTQSNFKSTSRNNDSEHKITERKGHDTSKNDRSLSQQNDAHKKLLNIATENHQSALYGNKSHFNKTLNRRKKKKTSDTSSRYSFIDIDRLQVDINSLDKVYQPPKNLTINLPSPNSHPFTRLISVKGDPSIIIFNRIPQCYEFTMGSILQDMSYLHSFKYVKSEINAPFSYNESSLLSIARSVYEQKPDRLIYERHIYFFDFYSLQFPVHPVWINIIQDPIYRITAEYQRSREVCRQTDRCSVPKDLINETLDQCVLKRSPKECISSVHNVSRMLPFFCGLKDHVGCQEENDLVLNRAKENINFFYTVIGLAEDFYKFLYVLEKILPQYFGLSRLVFMNRQDTKLLADIRDLNVTLPSKQTADILKPFLTYEYNIYSFIKQRLLDQYRTLVELDN